MFNTCLKSVHFYTRHHQGVIKAMGQGEQNKDVRDRVDLTETIYSAFLHTSLQRDKLTFLSHTR